MVDTFIANANADEYVFHPKAQIITYRSESLRAICRNLLASGTPGIANLFTSVARSRARQTSSKVVIRRPFFVKNTPSSSLVDALRRARTIYGCGLGFASLPILTEVVGATIGLRWDQDGDMVKALADIDTDITQAIQVKVQTGRKTVLTFDIRAAKRKWSVHESRITPQHEMLCTNYAQQLQTAIRT